MDQDELTIAMGNLAGEIGEPGFHQRLLDLMGQVLPHEMGWIVSYRPDADPDVLHTLDIDDELVDYYLQARPRSADPYLCSWRGNAFARVETLQQALPQATDRNFYALDFKRRANLTDEVALFLPVPGTSCISVFLGRRERPFTGDEIGRLQALFPAMLNFHHAHMRALFGRFCMDFADGGSIADSAVVVLDRFGKPVLGTRGWRQLRDRERWSRLFTQGSSAAEVTELAAHASSSLRSLTLDAANPVAPGGAILYLANPHSASDEDRRRAAEEMFARLTPRERDILLLTLDGLSTGVIAQRLNIAKGSIKNCRLRIYRKLGVSSERAMISTVMPFAGQLRGLLSDG